MTETEKKITATNDKNPNPTNDENILSQDQIEEPKFNISEICSKYMVDKLISQTITIIHSKTLEQNLGQFCFDFLKNNINSFLNGQFISHENGNDKNKEKKEEENENENNFYFKIPVQKEKNSWIELNEPQCPIEDTYLQDRMKFEPFIREDDDVIKDTLSEFNVTELKKKEESNLNEENKKIDNKKIDKNKQKNIKNNKINKKNEKNEKNENKKESEQISLFAENGEYKGPLIEYPSFPLAEEKYINIYIKNDNSVEVKNLRREMEIEKLKKFQLKKIEEEKIRKEKLKQIALRNQKEFDGSSYTFDSNGKIISIHKQNNNKFSKEFYNVRPRIGFGKVFQNEVENNEKNKKNKKKKRNSKDENSLIEKTINNLEKSIDPFNEDKTKVFAIRRTSDSELKTSELARKIKADGKKQDNKKDIQIEYNNNNNDFLYNKISKITTTNNEPIIISGNNYDFIVPETGVIIKNERNRGRKEGGFDFSKKYNRPTWDDCVKIINDSVQLNSKKYKGGTFSPSKKIPQSANLNNNINRTNSNNEINVNNSADLNNIYYNNYSYNPDNNLLNDYSGNNSSLNSSRNINNIMNSNNNMSNENSENTLIKNAYSVLKQSHSGLNSLSNSLAYSYNTIDYYNRKNRSSNLINSIQLSKNLNNSNLHSLFIDNKDENNNFNDDEYSNNNRYLNENGNIINQERNLFKNNIKNRKKLFENQYQNQYQNNSENVKKNFDNINNFNSQIIRSQNWGTNLNSGPDLYDNNYKKPHKTNHIKEMGYKIVTTKLPRERRLYNGNFEKSRDYIKQILFEES
jgi:hypothetical protein